MMGIGENKGYEWCGSKLSTAKHGMSQEQNSFHFGAYNATVRGYDPNPLVSKGAHIELPTKPQ